MSVVNQMLRDLDRRQAAAERRIFGQHLQPSGARHRGRWLFLALGALAAGGAVAFVLRGFEFGAAAPQRQAVAAPTTPAPADASALNAAVPAQSVAAPAAADAASPEPNRVPQEPPQAVAVQPAADQTAPLAARDRSARPAPSVDPSPSAAARGKSASPPARIAEASLAPATPAEPAPPQIDKQFRDNPARSADAEFRRAAALMEQGRMEAATAALRSALAADPRHEAARQTLAAVLIEAGAVGDAEGVLAEGLQLNPAQSNFALVLARLKLERGDTSGALDLLRAHSAAAGANPEYRAFVAALLRRLGRHTEAIEEYQAALKLAPGVGVWWIGLGLSQEAADRSKEATEAFRRAKASGTLSAGLADFVDRKLQGAR